MGTPFEDIYIRASFRFTDYDFLQLDFDQRFEILGQYLKMAEADFKKTCPYDLSKKDDWLACYTEKLDYEAVEILSLGVAYYWLCRRLMNSDLLRNSMSTKEYTFFSNANLVREINVFRDDLYKEYKQKIIDYSYYNGSLSSLGGGEQ